MDFKKMLLKKIFFQVNFKGAIFKYLYHNFFLFLPDN